MSIPLEVLRTFGSLWGIGAGAGARFEHVSGACIGDTTAEVLVTRHRPLGVAELIGRSSSGEPCLVHEGCNGLAEYVGRHPFEASGSEGIAKIGLRV
jgi:hypothetical protein